MTKKTGTVSSLMRKLRHSWTVAEAGCESRLLSPGSRILHHETPQPLADGGPRCEQGEELEEHSPRESGIEATGLAVQERAQPLGP